MITPSVTQDDALRALLALSKCKKQAEEERNILFNVLNNLSPDLDKGAYLDGLKGIAL
jgi:hypothetical protein